MNSITQLATQGRADTLVREIRCRSLYSSYYFVKVLLGYSALVDHFHGKEMESFLQFWEQESFKQWIEWARGSFKTSCFTIGTSMWGVLPPDHEDKSYALDKLGFSEEQWDLRMALHDRDISQLLAFETIDLPRS